MTDRSDSKDETEARRHALYNTGTTTVFASRADPRFSFSLFVPPSAGPSTTILVAVHGTGRRMF
ncbi:MAG: alpha/beta hydrolase, partial [Pseudomonadota bacterium]